MLEPERCVATITRGKNKWHRCSKPGKYTWAGMYKVGDTPVKLCYAHYDRRYAQLKLIVTRYLEARYRE